MANGRRNLFLMGTDGVQELDPQAQVHMTYEHSRSDPRTHCCK